MRNRSLLTSASLGAPSESFPRFILMPPPPPKPRFDMMTEQRAWAESIAGSRAHRISG